MARIGMACAAALLAGCISFNVALFEVPGPLEEETVQEGEGAYKVLLLDVDGLITAGSQGGVFSRMESPVAFLKERLTKARKDKKVKAVVLRVNSPGGGVTASDVMYEELRVFREETRIPVVACFMGVAASGGYYISMAADRIVCLPTSVTGSIGVIAQLAAIERLLEKIGVEPVTIKSGKYKDIGSPLRPPTDEEKEIMQKLVGGLYERFVNLVAAGRRMDVQEARSIADGRVYDAREALRLRLVDTVGYLPDAIQAAQEMAGIEKASVVMYQRPGEYRSNIYSAQAESADNPLSALAGKFLLEPEETFYYLWIAGK